MKWIDRILWMSATLIGASCTSTGQGNDGGFLEDLFDETPMENSSDLSGAEVTAEYDASNTLVLNIPAGVQLCNFNGLTTWQQSGYRKTRYTLHEATLVWPIEQAQMEIDLVSKVEVSPEAEEATVTGPGQLQARPCGVETPSNQQLLCLGYSQGFQFNQEPLEASFAFIARLPADSGKKFSDISLAPWIYFCDGQASYVRAQVTVDVSNGDQITFNDFYNIVHGCFPPDIPCLSPTGFGDLNRGSFIRGLEERVVQDYFKLALSCAHHGGPTNFIMLFDAPLEGIYGIQLTSAVSELWYLDSALAPIQKTKDYVLNVVIESIP